MPAEPPPPGPRDERLERLTARVQWLDRYHRWVAIGITLVIAPLLILELVDALGTGWPRIHVTMSAIAVTVATWWISVLGLAGLTALWETECAHRLRTGGLPRAVANPRDGRAS